VLIRALEVAEVVDELAQDTTNTVRHSLAWEEEREVDIGAAVNSSAWVDVQAQELIREEGCCCKALHLVENQTAENRPGRKVD
jgi:hypothetical protein